MLGFCIQYWKYIIVVLVTIIVIFWAQKQLEFFVGRKKKERWISEIENDHGEDLPRPMTKFFYFNQFPSVERIPYFSNEEDSPDISPISPIPPEFTLPHLPLPIFTPPPLTYFPPRVKRSRGEEECCRVLEEIFHLPFARERPGFLRNPETGYNLELDCYNAHLRLAIEYQGIQHYVYPNYTNQAKEQFIQQIRRDRFKIEACDRNGVYLIIVPYTIELLNIRQYLLDRLPETLRRYRYL